MNGRYEYVPENTRRPMQRRHFRTGSASRARSAALLNHGAKVVRTTTYSETTNKALTPADQGGEPVKATVRHIRPKPVPERTALGALSSNTPIAHAIQDGIRCKAQSGDPVWREVMNSVAREQASAASALQQQATRGMSNADKNNTTAKLPFQNDQHKKSPCRRNEGSECHVSSREVESVLAAIDAHNFVTNYDSAFNGTDEETPGTARVKRAALLSKARLDCPRPEQQQNSNQANKQTASVMVSQYESQFGADNSVLCGTHTQINHEGRRPRGGGGLCAPNEYASLNKPYNGFHVGSTGIGMASNTKPRTATVSVADTSYRAQFVTPKECEPAAGVKLPDIFNKRDFLHQVQGAMESRGEQQQ